MPTLPPHPLPLSLTGRGEFRNRMRPTPPLPLRERGLGGEGGAAGDSLFETYWGWEMRVSPDQIAQSRFKRGVFELIAKGLSLFRHGALSIHHEVGHLAKNGAQDDLGHRHP